MALVFTGALGCGAVDTSPGADTPPESIGTQRSAVGPLGNEFSPNTPTIGVGNEGPLHVAGARAGYGYGANLVNVYELDAAPTEISQWVIAPFPGGQSARRPFVWWEASRAGFASLYSDSSDPHQRIKDGGVDVLPTLTSVDPLGPPSAIHMNNHNDCTFALYGDATTKAIYQSCTSDGNPWEDWGLDLPPLPPSPDASLVPTMSPIALNRSHDSESLYYGCTFAGFPTEVCEYRLTGPGAGKTFKANFGAGASFIDGTRPTALTNSMLDQFAPADFNDATERWMFAAIVNGSVRSVVGMRETGAVESASQQVYSTSVIESTTSNVTYSTPMAHIRADRNVEVLYFRTQGTGTTRLMESIWSGSSWSAPVEIQDIGTQVPLPNEPRGYVFRPDDNGTPSRDSVLYRQPYQSTQVNDVVELQQTPTSGSGYLKTVLPNPGTPSELNFFVAPSAIDNSAWIKNRTAMGAVNAAVAPDGTSTADFVHETATTGAHEVYQNITGPDPRLAYRLSVYLKADTRFKATLLLDSNVDASSSVSATVDLLAGQITSTSAAGQGRYLDSSIEAMGNGWYHVTLIGKPTTVAGAQLYGEVFLLDANGNTGYAGNTTGGLILWGAELSAYEQGNLISQPSVFENAAWTKNRLTEVVANSLAAPDGTSGADFLRENTANGSHGIYQNVLNAPSTDTYTWSVYLKKRSTGTRTGAMLMLDANSDPNSTVRVYVDLAAGTITQTSATNGAKHVSSSIQAVGNLWYRVTLTGRPTNVPGTQVYGEVYILNAGSLSYTGDTSNGMYVWGGELTNAFPKNLVASPNAFDLSPWIRSRVTAVSSAIVAPDGLGTAQLVRDNGTTTGSHSFEQRIAGAATRTYSWTVYLKGGVRTQGELYLTTLEDPASGLDLSVDLFAGTVTSAGALGTATLLSSTMQAAGNGWYRLNVRGVPRGVAGSTTVRAVTYMLKNGSSSYQGDNASGFYAWGGELLAEK